MHQVMTWNIINTLFNILQEKMSLLNHKFSLSPTQGIALLYLSYEGNPKEPHEFKLPTTL